MIIRNMGQRLFMTQEQIDDCVGIDWDNPTAFIEAELNRATTNGGFIVPPSLAVTIQHCEEIRDAAGAGDQITRDALKGKL